MSVPSSPVNGSLTAESSRCFDKARSSSSADVRPDGDSGTTTTAPAVIRDRLFDFRLRDRLPFSRLRVRGEDARGDPVAGFRSGDAIIF